MYSVKPQAEIHPVLLLLERAMNLAQNLIILGLGAYAAFCGCWFAVHLAMRALRLLSGAYL